jgi:hypothetical protein
MMSDWFSLIICVNKFSSIYGLKMFLTSPAIEIITINFYEEEQINYLCVFNLFVISMCLSVYGESLRWSLISWIVSLED